ncbi:signal transduction histidine kinase [Massilia sp. UYP32]|jgi:signal transduction histidine kinase|uniref:histidine kinase n=1 Tax=Massilia timonae TaxID=47229 RepID=A0A1S2N3F6_9BURK|nr:MULTISPECIES: hybrid sensor histidine kinase/response regulator [Massilia]OIJ39615.1 response regulator [Massilia timonae]QYG03958.1 hybrid sensor histidine kinase/response regulator [Massilia sp. NP310]HAK90123.1 hybrid sensor histidine kinase/response regulator [Massilia timonae]
MNQDPSKILIVDDLPENLQALEALLRHDQRVIYQAGSGEQALALLLEHEFALAILDVQMPGMDGFELAEVMRSTTRTRHIPIVFVSAAGRELDYAFKGYESGAVDFMYKPLDADAVRSKVNVFVALDQQRRETRRQMLALEQSRQEQEVLLRELNQTQQELQRSLRMRDEFMSLVAHELRTPLNTLFLETQMRSLQLKRGNTAAFGAQQMEAMIQRDERQIKSMIRLIDDMLDVSRMRSGKLSIRPAQVELMNLLERVVSDLSLQAATTGSSLTLRPHDGVTGCWDEFRVEQVIVNLLTNALRYGCGQPVEVSVERSGDMVRIDVRDQGKGIASSDLERIFEPYERGARNGEPKGLGLGLYISRQLAISHGGELRVTSKPGEGSVFSLVLPCTDVPVCAEADV